MNRKTTVVVVAALQIALLSALLTWHVSKWHSEGWIGLAYSPAVLGENEARATELVPFGGSPREIAVIAPQSPASRSGVVQQEKVISINGQDVSDTSALLELDRAARKGDALTYLLEHEGSRRELTLTLESPFRSVFFTANQVVSVVVGLTWLTISLLVYWSRPRSQPAIVFFLLCSAAAAMYFTWTVAEVLFPSTRGVMPMEIQPVSAVAFVALSVLSVLFANFLLHLALVFPKRRPVTESWPRVFHWLHTAPFLQFLILPATVLAALSGRRATWLAIFETVTLTATILILVQLLRAARDEGWRQAVASRPFRVQLLFLLLCSQLGLAIRLIPNKETAGIIFGILFAVTAILVFIGWVTLYSILTCVALYRSYRESGIEVRTQVRWPLWGTLTALGGSFLILIFSLVLGYLATTIGPVVFSLASAASLVNKAIYLLIPIGFAFAILKYRLLEIDLVIRKTVIYSGVTGIVLVLYLLLAGISGVVFVRTAGLQSETATVFSTLAVVALFVPIRNRVQAFVDRRFFQRERDLEAARHRSEALVSGSSDLERLLPSLAEEAQTALLNRSIAIFIRAGEDLRLEASVGLPDAESTPLTIAADSPVLQTGEVVSDIAAESRAHDPSRALKRSRARIVAVARRGDDNVGLIVAGPKLGGEGFDREDEAFLESMAAQLVLAIGRSDQSRSRAELSRAREIQRSLLPTTLPQIEGVAVAARWQPAREVSGDYYDVLRLDDHRLALCIGDVVGKGMPAALLMSSLQAALKAVASQVHSPREVCTQVRNVMLQSLAGGTFITFFFCVVDRRSGRLTYTNAGHNPPLLVRRDGAMEELDVGGPILARIASEMTYDEASVSIGSGDRLVLYTDGVTEATDANDEMFEEERLEELALAHRDLSAAGLETVIAEAVIAHAEGRLQDDLTLVVAAIS